MGYYFTCSTIDQYYALLANDKLVGELYYPDIQAIVANYYFHHTLFINVRAKYMSKLTKVYEIIGTKIEIKNQ